LRSQDVARETKLVMSRIVFVHVLRKLSIFFFAARVALN